MANIAFSSLKLKTDNKVNKFTFNGKEIEVKQYLPADDKNSILELTVQEADKGSVVNTFALDCLFHLYIVMEYTNVIFTDKQKNDKFNTYDMLESSGFIDEVIKNMNVQEYSELKTALDDIVEKYAIYRNSFKGALEQLQLFAPNQAEIMKNSIESMDYEKMTNIIQLAAETGMGNLSE